MYCVYTHTHWCAQYRCIACVCVYMCYVCVYTCIALCVYMYTCITCIHTHVIHVYTYTCNACIHTRVCVYTCNTNVCVYRHAVHAQYMYCMCMFILHVYVYMFMYTHTHVIHVMCIHIHALTRASYVHATHALNAMWWHVCKMYAWRDMCVWCVLWELCTYKHMDAYTRLHVIVALLVGSFKL